MQLIKYIRYLSIYQAATLCSASAKYTNIGHLAPGTTALTTRYVLRESTPDTVPNVLNWGLFTKGALPHWVRSVELLRICSLNDECVLQANHVVCETKSWPPLSFSNTAGYIFFLNFFFHKVFTYVFIYQISFLSPTLSAVSRLFSRMLIEMTHALPVFWQQCHQPLCNPFALRRYFGNSFQVSLIHSSFCQHDCHHRRHAPAFS